MIIQCENCDSKYRIDALNIGRNGRFVRCSHCAHEWLVYCTEEDRILDKKNTLEQSHETHNIHDEQKHKNIKNNALRGSSAYIERRKTAKFYAAILFIGIALTLNIMLISLVSYNEGYYSWLHEAMGLNHSKNLKITDISIKMTPSRTTHTQELGLNFVIHNDGDENEKTSNIRITAFDKDRKRIAELSSSNSYVINAKETRVIHSLIKDVPMETRYISIEFSNNIDMILRPSSTLINGKPL